MFGSRRKILAAITTLFMSISTTAQIQIKEIAAGGINTCVLSDLGEAFCWGGNTSSQSGVNANFSIVQPTRVPGLPLGLKSLVANVGANDGTLSESCALSRDNQAWCWGYYNFQTQSATKLKWPKVQQLSIGSHRCVVDWQGFVQCSDSNSPELKRIPGFDKKARKTAVNFTYACALTDDAEVWCWGTNSFALLPVTKLAINAKDLTVNCAVIDGGVSCWKFNRTFSAGVSSVSVSTATQVAGLPGETIRKLVGSSETSHTCALTASGKLFCWGSNSYGQLGDGTATDRTSAIQVPGVFKEASANGNHTCAITISNDLRCWGDNTYRQLNVESTAFSAKPIKPLSTKVRLVNTSEKATCAIPFSGASMCWGEIGFETAITPRVEIKLDNQMASMAPGRRQCGLSAARGVACIEYPFYGSQATIEGTTSNNIAIFGGQRGNNACVISSSGALKCFGCNTGSGIPDENGNCPNQNKAVDVIGLTNGVTYAMVDRSHSCAIQQGSIKCWGFNSNGELGNATPLGANGFAASNTPLPVLGLPGLAKRVFAREVGGFSGAGAGAVGNRSTLAELEDGRFFRWGEAFLLAPGTIPPAPVEAPEYNGLADLVVGNDSECMLMPAGVVRCRGNNVRGQLGDGTNVNRNDFRPVQALPPVKKIIAGGRHYCAIDLTDELWCWGSNTLGQLGIGKLHYEPQPKLSSFSLPQLLNPNTTGLSGSWYDPETSGQGLLMEVFPGADGKAQVFAGWFTYSGAAGDSREQRWLSLSGTSDASNAVNLKILSNTGGRFDALPVTASTEIGTAKLEFASCTQGLLSYRFNDGRNGTIPLQRLTPANCGQAAVSRSSGSGLWYNQTTSGQGFVFDLTPSLNSFFAAWYTYGDAAQTSDLGQRWFTIQGSNVQPQGTSFDGLKIFETTGGKFDDVASANTREVGTASVFFAGCSRAVLRYEFTSGTNSGKRGEIELTRLGPSHVIDCSNVGREFDIVLKSNPSQQACVFSFNASGTCGDYDLILDKTEIFSSSFYLQFPTPQLAQAEEILSAKIVLKVKSAFNSSELPTQVAFPDRAWDQSSLTISSAPPVSGGFSPPTPPTAPGSLWIIDVTDRVKAWSVRPESNFGVYFSALPMADFTRRTFFTNEAQNIVDRPYLEIRIKN